MRLTFQELAVCGLLCQGLTNKEIARLLEITERTVKAHLGHIYAKYGVRTRLELVVRLINENKGYYNVKT